MLGFKKKERRGEERREENKREVVVKRQVIFTLFLLSFLVVWLRRAQLFRLRQSYLRELADSKLLEGQMCGEKKRLPRLFTETAAAWK